MPNRLTFNGLDDLRRDLRALPPDLVAEAGPLVLEAAESAAAAMIAAYPRGPTGNLKRGVKVKKIAAPPYGVAAVVQNVAALAWIFELGTQARHYFTKAGVKHLTGKMPPGHVFWPIVYRTRRALREKVKALIASKGLTVTGEDVGRAA